MEEKVANLLKDFPKDAFNKDLIQWFQTEQRKLPWREDKDPYKIWVSEVMLQQTRVDTVIPYYQRFLEKYPNIESLAHADEEELLKVWEGLGYYSRVRNLHQAVKEVYTQYGGIVPNNKQQFGKLKGVGPYTVGAVLSIAYGIPEPAVDGNVMRVLSRIFLIDDDITKTRTRKLFEEIVRRIIPHEDPSSFNQGLMELGALVCKVSSPSCLLCPVRDYCGAFYAGKQEDYPVKTKNNRPKTIHLIAAILIDKKERIIIRKRPNHGLLANLWEFPTEEIVQNASVFNWSVYAEELKRKHGITIHLDAPLGKVEHIFSHLKWNITTYIGQVTEDVIQTDSFKAIKLEELNNYPFPVPQQKILMLYQEFLQKSIV